jgi:hypothetical protein
MTTTRRLDFILAGLILATALTWWLGESGRSGTPVMAFVLGIAGAKSLFVILDFMALRGVRRLWQALLVGWLALVLLLIALAYRLAVS